MGINLKYNSNYLWRIIFTIMIALLHSNYTRIDQAYTGWYLAVDYFFVVSGFFLVHSAEHKKEATDRYMIRRIKKLYPHQLLSFIVIYTYMYIIGKKTGFFSGIIKHMGEYFYNFPIWYISVLLLSSFVIHYLVISHSELYKGVIAPCSVVLIYGYLYRNCASLNTGNNIGLFLNEYYIRGFAGMSLGAIIYYIVKELEKIQFKDIMWKILRLVEYSIFFGVIIITYNHGGKNDTWFVILIGVGVLCSFIRNKESIVNNKIMKYLNELMYPVFLNHVFIIVLLKDRGISGYSVKNILIYLIVLIVYSVFTKTFVQGCMNIGYKITKKLIAE